MQTKDMFRLRCSIWAVTALLRLCNNLYLKTLRFISSNMSISPEVAQRFQRPGPPTEILEPRWARCHFHTTERWLLLTPRPLGFQASIPIVLLSELRDGRTTGTRRFVCYEQLMYERRILSRVTFAGRQNVYVSSHTSPRNSRSS